jgi:hypothetical protein
VIVDTIEHAKDGKQNEKVQTGKHTSATEKKNVKVTEEREKREEGAGTFYMQPGSSGETKEVQGK